MSRSPQKEAVVNGSLIGVREPIAGPYRSTSATANSVRAATKAESANEPSSQGGHP